jgi:alpha-L-fucosidase
MKDPHIRFNQLAAFAATCVVTQAAYAQPVWPSNPKVADAVKQIEIVANRGPFKPTWESLEKHQTPQWYLDAKFGIFIHWGLYSVPAFANEWYPRRMYETNSAEYKHHIETWGPQSKFGYKDFIPMFKAERFDAKHWAKLFKEAGAKYVMPVAEHHDGFPMYDCSYTRWSAAKLGPQRDIVGELGSAVRDQGLTFCVSSHRIEHWWFMNFGRQIDSDVNDPQYADFYGPAREEKDPLTKDYMDDWLARSCELVDKYRPQVFWFDWWIEQPAMEPYRQKFAAYYYNRAAQWKKSVAINFKMKAFPMSAAVYDIERGQLDSINPHFWQTDTSVSTNSWGYVTEQNFKTTASLVQDLADIVSKNGCLLLNIGPKPDGTIPEPEERMLLEIGQWLKVNGEAIYGTRPWKVFGEGPTKVLKGGFTDTKRQPFSSEDIRFTTKGNALYAITLVWPSNGKVVIKSLAKRAGHADGTVTKVSLLGYRGKLVWAQTAQGLEVALPEKKLCDDASTLKINGKDLEPVPVEPAK